MIYGRHSVGRVDLRLRSFGFASAKPQDDTRLSGSYVRRWSFAVGLWSAT